MNTQSIFQVGNSNVVAIPSHLMRELGLKKGQEVIVDRIPDSNAIVVTPKTTKKTGLLSDNEYKLWLKKFFDEDGALLDELASR